MSTCRNAAQTLYSCTLCHASMMLLCRTAQLPRLATWAVGRRANRTSVRSMSKALVFERHGEPEDVLQYVDWQNDAMGAEKVLLELIAAPINPSDVNTVQGKYPIAPSMPGVPGHEGAMRVVQVGEKVSALQPGDAVVPLEGALGTWRSGGVFDAAAWHKVPRELPDDVAATLCINPPTALCMLEQFVDLQPGATVVQNGATSAVGQHVIQLAKAKGLKTINVIRDRPNWDATVEWLKGMGADVVTTEEKLKKDMDGLPPPALGLNCIGGSAATAVAKVLRPGGVMVTYGAMSMQPVPLPTGLLIFKDISFKGFWMSGSWAKKAGPEGRAQLADKVAAYFLDGTLKPPKFKRFALSAYKDALAASKEGLKNVKVLLVPDGAQKA